MSINVRVEAATASMESSATATAADAARIGTFVNDQSGEGHYTTTGGVPVTTLPALVNQIYDDVREQANGYAGFLSPPWGVFDGIVTGNTNGSNRDFDIIGMGFYPSYSFFNNGKKVPDSQIVRTGNRVKLPVAPISGAVVEATGGADPDRIAPEGYKSLTFVSNKNGTINLSVSGITTPLPKWKVGGVITEGLTFNHVNDGSIVSVHLYLPESNMGSAIIDAENEGVLLLDAQPMAAIMGIKLRENPMLSARGLASVDTSNGTRFENMLIGCSSLASVPLFDTSKGTSFYAMLIGCSSLTAVPLFDTSNGTRFDNMLIGCSSLTAVPLFDTSNGTRFEYMLYGCSSLASVPLFDTSKGTSFYAMLTRCSSLTAVPAELFNAAKSIDYANAFVGCALTQQSVDNVLVSIAASVAATPTLINGKLNMDGGTSATPSATGLTAKAALVAAGWTVTHN